VRILVGSGSVCPVAQTLLSVRTPNCLKTREPRKSGDLFQVHQGKLTHYLLVGLFGVGVVGEDGEGAVELFGQHYPGQLVGHGER